MIRESHAPKFERGVRTLLADGGWAGTTWRVDAAFGVFGSLPLVGVTFGDAFVLVDCVNGGVGGPFAVTSDLSADALLAAHSPVYASGSPVRFYSRPGCGTTTAARWRNSFCVFCTVPPVTWTPTPVGMAFFCFATGVQSKGRSIGCTCEQRGTLVYGTPPVTYPVRVVCDCGTGTVTPCPTGWVAAPPTPPCTTSCPTQYWY
ncbi:MAG: hypothetical protein ACK4WH_07730 [Phycisphaerales bacterium]